METAQLGISQHRRQLLHVETPCALRFWKVTFLTRRESQGIGSQNPHEEIRWLVLPACAAGGCPGPPTAREPPGCLWMPNLQDFQAWLKYFSVIWCRGRSRLKLTQIYSSLPG